MHRSIFATAALAVAAVSLVACGATAGSTSSTSVVAPTSAPTAQPTAPPVSAATYDVACSQVYTATSTGDEVALVYVNHTAPADVATVCGKFDALPVPNGFTRAVVDGLDAGPGFLTLPGVVIACASNGATVYGHSDAPVGWELAQALCSGLKSSTA